MSTLPTVQYSTAIHTMKPGMVVVLPLKLNEKLPDSAHSTPTKLTSVTTAFRKPIDRPMVWLVNRFTSSCRRWSGLSGTRWPGWGRPASVVVGSGAPA